MNYKYDRKTSRTEKILAAVSYKFKNRILPDLYSAFRTLLMIGAYILIYEAGKQGALDGFYSELLNPSQMIVRNIPVVDYVGEAKPVVAPVEAEVQEAKKVEVKQ